MRKITFIALFGILFLAGCNSSNKPKEASPAEATEIEQDTTTYEFEEVEGAIDDSGEIGQDSTEEVESE
jgi:PBP1b-binding outer membrane lipoprotein LpoB